MLRAETEIIANISASPIYELGYLWYCLSRPSELTLLLLSVTS